MVVVCQVMDFFCLVLEATLAHPPVSLQDGPALRPPLRSSQVRVVISKPFCFGRHLLSRERPFRLLPLPVSFVLARLPESVLDGRVELGVGPIPSQRPLGDGAPDAANHTLSTPGFRAIGKNAEPWPHVVRAVHFPPPMTNRISLPGNEQIATRLCPRDSSALHSSHACRNNLNGPQMLLSNFWTQ